MSLKKDFGLRLKEIRTKRGYTQFQLAEKAGIDAKHMSHIETGRSFPKADLIEKFAAILEVDYGDFFNFSEYKDREKLLELINNIIKNTNNEKLKKIYFLLTHLFQ